MLIAITCIIILGVLILFHEVGHFVTARIFKVKVEEFGFGFPPKIFGRKLKNSQYDTEYSINWIPLGGFVKLKGENGDEGQAPDSFASQKIWQRIIILSAGVTMNIVLAGILLSVNAGIGMPAQVDAVPAKATVRDVRIQIDSVLVDSPAARADLKSGDVIKSIDGQIFSTIGEIQNYMAERQGQEVALLVKRGAAEITKTAIPTIINQEDNKAKIGMALAKVGLVSYPWYLAPVEGIKATFYITMEIFRVLGEVIHKLFTHEKIGLDVSGPVGIVVMTGKVIKLGLSYVLQLAALLSINLAIINFLPFPALDGGRVFFLLIEAVRRKPLNQKIEGAIHNIGFMFLMVLIVLVTFKDLKSFGYVFQGLWQKIIG